MAWRISRFHIHEEAMNLIDDAILAEELLDVDKEDRPVVVNDRGVQMKAKEVKQMFTDMGLTQTFSRPRTPNDNPFIESFFSSTKRTRMYPGLVLLSRGRPRHRIFWMVLSMVQHRALPFTHWVCNPGTAAPRPCFRDYRRKKKLLAEQQKLT